MSFYIEKAERKHWCKDCGKEIKAGDSRLSFDAGSYRNYSKYERTCIPCGLRRLQEKAKDINLVIEKLNETKKGEKIGTLYIPPIISIQEFEGGIGIKPYKGERFYLNYIQLAELIWLKKGYSAYKLYTEKELEEEIAKRVAKAL